MNIFNEIFYQFLPCFDSCQIHSFVHSFVISMRTLKQTRLIFYDNNNKKVQLARREISKKIPFPDENPPVKPQPDL